MAKQNSVNLDITNNSDGFDISGGTTSRKLTISGGDISITSFWFSYVNCSCFYGYTCYLDRISVSYKQDNIIFN